jgi:hypothetical protein
MSELESKDYKPNDRELRLFEQEKMDLYKGTFVVCIVYGLSAFILLVVILFTEWGKEFIYDKFAPAVITYILGSLIIIIYLLNAIFSIKPRKVGTDMDSDHNIICPDFWKLERVDDTTRAAIIANNEVANGKGKIIPTFTSDKNANLQYRCVYDPNVQGTTKELLAMKNAMDNSTTPYMAGFKKIAEAASHRQRGDKSTLTPDYIVKKPQSTTDNAATYQDIQKYAKFSGAYGATNDSNNKVDTEADTTTLKIATSDYITTARSGSSATATAANTVYKTTTPLMCNVVYPQVLGVLDKDTKEKNEVSCEYAKQCGVSWSSLKCR